MKTVPWRRIYTEYIVPLSKMFRGLRSSYVRRSDDAKLRTLISTYVAGCRAVLGVPFMENKGLWHRTSHLVDQAAGKQNFPLSAVLLSGRSFRRCRRVLFYRRRWEL